jgi:hypothetical protein
MKIMIFVLLVASNIQTCFADEYEIIFSEGAYSFDKNKGYSDLDNKYLAKVTIKKNGEIITNDVTIRGSTLSDSIFYYEMWNNETNINPPTDDDIKDIFIKWDKESDISNTDVPPNLINLINDVREIIKYLASVPVIKSGSYEFTMGCHKNGTSVYGHPYAVRIKGGIDEKEPYNGKIDSTNLIDGGIICTINRNSSFKNKCLANGVNIHNGRRQDTYKDSTGCMTIHPDDWEKFYSRLPNPYIWAKEKHKGKLTIDRGPNTKTPIDSICDPAPNTTIPSINNLNVK